MFARTIFGAVSLAALSLACAFGADPARAQLVSADPASNSVLIDLGAIDGGAASAPVIGSASRFAAPGTGGGQLMLPPQSAPASRLLGPDGRPLSAPSDAPMLRDPTPEPRAPRLTQPRAQPRAEPQSQPKAVAKAAPAPRAEPTARPTLPPVALPTVPAAPAPAPVAIPKGDAPIALDTPTPPPASAGPTPVPNIPSMEIVGPQASVTPSAPAQPKATQPKSTPAAKAPTPPPAVAAPAPVDATPPSAPAAPAAKSAPKAEQQAALPPATKAAPPAAKGAAPQGMEIRFAAGDANLSDDAKAALDKLADSIKGDEKSRLQLLAYASEDQASPSKARRLSLSRALAVRSHLIAKGIRSTRIDVRALGDQIPGGEPNRVDLKVSDR